jgi:hypothetical protein
MSSSMVSIRFSGQRTGIFNATIGKGVQHPSRAIILSKVGKIFRARIVRQFRLFLSIQVIEVAIELIKTMSRGQKLVLIAEVVFAELSGGVTLFF